MVWSQFLSYVLATQSQRLGAAAAGANAGGTALSSRWSGQEQARAVPLYPLYPMMLNTLEEKQNFTLLLVSEQKNLLDPEARCPWPHSRRDQLLQ